MNENEQPKDREIEIKNLNDQASADSFIHKFYGADKLGPGLTNELKKIFAVFEAANRKIEGVDMYLELQKSTLEAPENAQGAKIIRAYRDHLELFNIRQMTVDELEIYDKKRNSPDFEVAPGQESVVEAAMAAKLPKDDTSEMTWTEADERLVRVAAEEARMARLALDAPSRAELRAAGRPEPTRLPRDLGKGRHSNDRGKHER